MSIEIIIGLVVLTAIICWVAYGAKRDMEAGRLIKADDHGEPLAPPVPQEPPTQNPAPAKPLPATLGDLIKEESPPKRPRKPRPPKAAPSPEVIKVYADPTPPVDPSLDKRLDGNVKKPKVKKAKQATKTPEAWPFPMSRPEDKSPRVQPSKPAKRRKGSK